MSNINAIPFLRQLSEKIAKVLRRDMIELESLQKSPLSAIKYAKIGFEKFSDFLIDECFAFDRSFGIYIKGLNSIRAIKKVEKPTLNWHINPISNLFNFAHANNNFAVSIALTNSKKEVLAAMIYLPSFDTLYYAQRHRGCYKVDHMGNLMRVSVANRSIKDVIISGVGRSALEKFQSLVDIRQSKLEISGCMLIDSINLASGKIDFMVYNRDWRISCYAAELLIKEAGGAFEKQETDDLDQLNIIAGNNALLKNFEIE